MLDNVTNGVVVITDDGDNDCVVEKVVEELALADVTLGVLDDNKVVNFGVVEEVDEIISADVLGVV